MIDTNFYKLELPVKFLKDDLKVDPVDSLLLSRPLTSDYMTQEAIEFFDKIKVTLPKRFLLISVPPLGGNQIHVDLGVTEDKHVIPRYWAINCPIVHTEVDTHWYTKLPSVDSLTAPRAVGTPGNYPIGTAEMYQPHEVTEVQKSSLSGPTLVRVDVPHCVRNCHPTKTAGRISIRVSNFLPSWEKAVEFFKPWIAS